MIQIFHLHDEGRKLAVIIKNLSPSYQKRCHLYYYSIYL